MALEVTIDDLRRGTVARLSEGQYAKIRNCSRSLLQKERGRGVGIPFFRTPRGRIFYDPNDVLTELDGSAKHLATCEYPQTQSAKNIEKARIKDVSQESAKQK